MTPRADSRTGYEKFLGYGALWIPILAISAPVVFWRMGEPAFGCFISPLVVMVFALVASPIVVLTGWKRVLLNWHTAALMVVAFFWWQYGNEIVRGPFRGASIEDAETIKIDSGEIWKISDFIPFEEFEGPIRKILAERLIGERINKGDLRSAAREIVSRGYGLSNLKRLDKWQAEAKKRGYGHWGNRSMEMDGLTYANFQREVQDD